MTTNNAEALRALLAEARREYRDCDAAGDVLDWLDERVETLAAQPPAVSVDEAMVERSARVLALLIGANEADWRAYEIEARESLTTALNPETPDA